MRPYAISLLSLILLVCGMALTGQAGTAEPSCASERVRIHAATPQEALLACAGIADAAGFFRDLGFSTDVAVDITIHGKVTAHEAGDLAFPAFGRYRPRPHRIFMTSLDGQRAMAHSDRVFHMPFDTAQVREVAAHEAGHVFIEHNLSAESPSRLLHEYIAYIVQFATMDPVRRGQIIAIYDTGPFENAFEINPLIHAIAPDVFAVKAWLYYAAQPDRAGYLRRIMADDLPAGSYRDDLLD